MALMPMVHMHHKIEQQLKSMSNKDAVEVRTYKKDRGFVIFKQSQNIFSLIEFGYINDCLIGDKQQIKKQLTKVIKKEFPRSNQAWVQYFQNVDNPYQLQGKQPQIALF